MSKRVIGLVGVFITMGAMCVVAADAGPPDDTRNARSMTVGTNATNSQNGNIGKQEPDRCPRMTLASLTSHVAHVTGLVAASGSCSCQGTPCGVSSNSCTNGTHASCTRIPFSGSCSCDCQ